MFMNVLVVGIPVVAIVTKGCLDIFDGILNG